METIFDILRFCHEYECTPKTIIFDKKWTSDNLDDIVENWNIDHKSFLDKKIRINRDSELYSLRRIILRKDKPMDRRILTNWNNFEMERSMCSKAYDLLKDRKISIPTITVESYRVNCKIHRIDLGLIFQSTKLSIMVYKNMRKISTNFHEKIPDWFFEELNIDLIYTRVENTDIKIKEDEFSFKYERGKDVNLILDGIVRSIGIEIVELTSSKFVTSSVIHLKETWNKHILADIITNDREVCQIMSLQESFRPLYEKKYISSLCMFSKFTIIDDEQIRVRISSSSCYTNSQLVLSLVVVLFEIYDEVYEKINKIYSKVLGDKDVNKVFYTNSLKKLREAEPDLFINNYTRECPILPIMISEEESRTEKNVLNYCGRFYKAPQGYYIGLKLNRLSNKEKYKYLVTCYTTNHFARKGSVTYKYIHEREIPEKTNFGRNNNGNRRIYSEEYGVYRSESFPDLMRKNFGEKEINNKNIFSVCRQEAWYLDNDQIEKDIEENLDGSIYYRYFEEIYKCNILVVFLSKGEFDILIPPHRGKYIWNRYSKNRGVIVIKVLPPAHTKGSHYYEILLSGSTPYIFDTNEHNICTKLLEKKRLITYDGIKPNMKNIYRQYTNEDGKCIMVEDEDGTQERCNCRPFLCKILTLKNNILKDHFDSMNDVRMKNGLKMIRWEQSNSKYIYFPNLDSAISWRTNFIPK